ncbi:hypothetical protein ACVXHB_26905 [Escherichia coli]
MARKLPIVLGMLLASTIILCNYTNNTTLVVMLMALAFFGKGFGALGWPVILTPRRKRLLASAAASLTSLAMLPPLSLHW